MSKKIYIVRHGAVNNPNGVIYGRLPGYELSKKGKAQVQESALFLKNTQIASIKSSPLLRAKQTAIIIQKELNISKIAYDDALIEIRSSLQGKSFDYLRSINANYYASNIRQSNDETIEDIATRMKIFIQQIINKSPHKSEAIISHGEPIMILTALINKQPLTIKSIRPGRDKYVKYAEVREIYDNGKKLTIQTMFIPNQ